MPAQALTSIVINAPPKQVWDVLVDFDAYPSWNTWFISIKAHTTPLNLGTQVTFSHRMSPAAKPGTYTVRITTWKPDTESPGPEFAWKGGPLPEMLGWLIRGHHWFRLVEQEGGTKTLFDHGEEAEGLLSVFAPQGMVDDIARLLNKFNEELKVRVEKGVEGRA